jgi:hypothetical protein
MSYRKPAPRYSLFPHIEVTPHRSHTNRAHSLPREYTLPREHTLPREYTPQHDYRHKSNHHHGYHNQHEDTPRVRFAKPIVRSISRKPTRLEFLYMNLLEYHVDRCDACEPMLNDELPYDCTRGRLLEKNILRNIRVSRGGKICSTDGEPDCEILVEVSSRYSAVLTLLDQTYPGRIIQRSRS